MTTAAERAALLRAERAEARAAELQQALVSAESDVKRLQHELRVAHGCLASVRVQRRAWRDECVEARRVVVQAKAERHWRANNAPLATEHCRRPFCESIRAYDAHAARRTPASDSEAEETPPSRHEGG